MIDLNVSIDARAVLEILDRLDDRHFKPIVAQAVADEVVLPALMKYPQKSGKKYPWKSEKQRRFVIAAIKSGAIQVPYQRSGDTGRSYQKRAIPDGIEVYSNRPSAAYTRGSPDIKQAAYHKGNWETHEELASSLEGDAALVATAAIVQIIGDAT